MGVRYGHGTGSIWKRHDLAVFGLPKAEVIASCGTSGKLDSKKSHLVTVIEILSRSNPSNDTIENVHLFEKHHIRAYYIVDLNKNRVDEYLFHNSTEKFDTKKTFDRSSQDSFLVEPTGVRFYFSNIEDNRRSFSLVSTCTLECMDSSPLLSISKRSLRLFSTRLCGKKASHSHIMKNTPSDWLVCGRATRWAIRLTHGIIHFEYHWVQLEPGLIITEVCKKRYLLIHTFDSCLVGSKMYQSKLEFNLRIQR